MAERPLTRSEIIQQWLGGPYSDKEGMRSLAWLVMFSSLVENRQLKPKVYSDYFDLTKNSEDKVAPTNFDLLVAATFWACVGFSTRPVESMQNSAFKLLRDLHKGNLPQKEDMENTKKLLQAAAHMSRKASADLADNYEAEGVKLATDKKINEVMQCLCYGPPGQKGSAAGEKMAHLSDSLGEDFPLGAIREMVRDAKDIALKDGKEPSPQQKERYARLRSRVAEQIDSYWTISDKMRFAFGKDILEQSEQQDNSAMKLTEAVQMIQNIEMLGKGLSIPASRAR
jgi:hypothetical protein